MQNLTFQSPIARRFLGAFCAPRQEDRNFVQRLPMCVYFGRSSMAYLGELP